MKLAAIARWPLMVLLIGWSYPYAVLGLLPALVLMALGQIQKFRPGDIAALDAVRVRPGLPVMIAVVRGPLGAAMKRRGWGGFTLGWVVFFWGPPGSPALVRHEVRHVEQALVLGPLFPLLYLLLLGFGVLGAAILVLGSHDAIGKPPRILLRDILRAAYRDHPLERDAQRAADAAR